MPGKNGQTIYIYYMLHVENDNDKHIQCQSLSPYQYTYSKKTEYDSGFADTTEIKTGSNSSTAQDPDR
jgi:hypothetical protein